MSFKPLLTMCCLLAANLAIGDTYDPIQFGAAPNDERSDTEAIQQAIDACFKAGGGVVELRSGRFVAGSFRLKTGVKLRIGKEATLECADDPKEFQRGVWIQAEDANHVGIFGPGKINGKGSKCFRIRFASIFKWFKDGARSGEVKHPVEVEGRCYVHMIQFTNCKGVTLKDLQLNDSQHWTVHVLGCRDVEIAKVRIRNVPYGPYTDGIDIDSSSNVRVIDCDVTAGDDAYCVKTTGKRNVRRPATDIRFERCIARSPTNGFKIGTETRFDILRVTLHRCRVAPAMPGIGPLGGLTITSVDGARVSHIKATDVEVQLARCPIFIRLGNRGRGQKAKPPKPGSITRVTLQRIDVRACTMPVIISGIVGAQVKEVLLESLTINRLGVGSHREPNSVPHHNDAYPEATMFGEIPGRVVFCRNASGVRLEKISAPKRTPFAGKDIVIVNCQRFEGTVDTK